MRNLSTYRRGRVAWSCIAGLAVVCGAVSTFAIDPNRKVSQYMREFWGTDRGFPGGSVDRFAVDDVGDGELGGHEELPFVSDVRWK